MLFRSAHVRSSLAHAPASSPRQRVPGTPRSDRCGWHDAAVVFIFLAWLAVGVAMWRGWHRWAMLGAVASMVLTLVMLKVHAPDVIGLCL